MRKLAILGVAAMVLAAGSFSIDSAIAAGDEALIEKRKTFMRKEILGPFKVIKSFVKDGKGTAQDVSANARALSAAAGKITIMYPKGTGRGDYDDKLTRALPKIWEDWKGFQSASNALESESAKLAKIADGGDSAAIGAQFGKMGKLGCGGCHKPFRGAKVK